MSNTFEKLYKEDYAVLFKSINSITVNDPVMKDAFDKFCDIYGYNRSVTIAELLSFNGYDRAKVKDGDVILSYTGNITNSKLIKNALSGLHSLMSLDKGFSLKGVAEQNNIDYLQTYNYVILPENKVEKMVKKGAKDNLVFKKMGKINSSNKASINCESGIESIDKSDFDKIDNIVITNFYIEDFVKGYQSACSVKISDCISDNNILRLGIIGAVEKIFARALGVFAASVQYKMPPIKIVFANEDNITVAVPRPNVADGDYFYLLKLRTIENGIPERIHYSQLCYYLTEKKREGIIKDVLPMKENIQSVLKRLQGESLVYEPLSELPENCYGAIVSVPRGESVNGLKLGYFKCK